MSTYIYSKFVVNRTVNLLQLKLKRSFLKRPTLVVSRAPKLITVTTFFFIVTINKALKFEAVRVIQALNPYSLDDRLVFLL